MVDRAGRQRGRDRDPVRPAPPRSERISTLMSASTASVASQQSRCERRLERLRVAALRPGRVERDRAEGAVERLVDRADLLEILVGQDRLRDLEPLVRARLVAEQVRPRPDHRHQRHDQALADRIDRRVGDLGEVLLEIVVEQPRPVREHGERRVGAHRADRIVALRRHRREEEFQILVGIAEAPAARREASSSDRRARIGLQPAAGP